MAQREVERSGIGDRRVLVALRDLEQRMHKRYGERFVRLILFGSRARGDERPDSDADVAVVLRGPMPKRWAEKEAIIDDTYAILLETGLYIQPWPIEERALLAPDSAPNPELLRAIIRDGVQL